MSTTSDADARACTSCGETVNAAALKCRFCGVWFDPAVEQARRRALAPSAAASPLLRAASALLLLSTPFYLWCSFTHVCMAGHFDHPPYPWWEFANEALWTSPFAVAAVLALLGGGPLRGLAIGVLVLARWFVGDVMPLDTAVFLGVALASIATLVRAARARGPRA